MAAKLEGGTRSGLPERLRRAIDHPFEDRERDVSADDVSKPFIAESPQDLSIFPAFGDGPLDESGGLRQRKSPQFLNQIIHQHSSRAWSVELEAIKHNARTTRRAILAIVDVSVGLLCNPAYFLSVLMNLDPTDFGRVIAVPTARFQIICDSIPMARLTLKSTV